MRKIHMTRQFFEASGRHEDFFEKQKTRFQIRSMGVCVPNFRSASFLVWPGDVTQINTYTNIQMKLGISSTGCSLHVDFDICQPGDEKSGNTVGCGALKISPIDFLC